MSPHIARVSPRSQRSVTAHEVRIECFFPVDDATREAAQALLLD